jgi:hypothetical protein
MVETSQLPARSRPIGTWLILSLYLALALQTILGYSTEKFTTSSGRLITLRLSTTEKVIRGTAIGLKFFAAIQLFRLRRSALGWFGAAWCVTIAVGARDFVAGLHTRHPGLVAAFSLFGLLVVSACLAYTYWLSNEGRLTRDEH